MLQSFPEFRLRRTLPLSRLSGGELRLVTLYVVVKSATQFVLLDEPFTHLTLFQIEQVKELLREEKQHKGFIITHHLYRHIIEVSDSLYVLANGKTHLTKNIEDVISLGYTRC